MEQNLTNHYLVDFKLSQTDPSDYSFSGWISGNIIDLRLSDKNQELEFEI